MPRKHILFNNFESSLNNIRNNEHTDQTLFLCINICWAPKEMKAETEKEGHQHILRTKCMSVDQKKIELNAYIAIYYQSIIE